MIDRLVRLGRILVTSAMERGAAANGPLGTVLRRCMGGKWRIPLALDYRERLFAAMRWRAVMSHGLRSSAQT